MQPEQTTVEKVAETVLSYYRLANARLPSTQEFRSWFESLVPASQAELVLLSLEQANFLPAFKRYILEGRGYSMPAYMAAHLTPQELPYWVDDNDGGCCQLNSVGCTSWKKGQFKLEPGDLVAPKGRRQHAVHVV